MGWRKYFKRDRRTRWYDYFQVENVVNKLFMDDLPQIVQAQGEQFIFSGKKCCKQVVYGRLTANSSSAG